MRKKQQQTHVRTITTGHVEADMLGQVYIWLAERQNRGLSQRPHRTYKRTRKLNISERYIRVWFRAAIEWLQTAPTACLRSLKAWQDKKDADVPKYLQGVRKQKRNGK